MDVNGESIYNSHPWTAAADNKADGVYFTTVGNDLYVHIAKPCASVKLKGLRKPGKVTVLGDKHSAKLSGSRLILPQSLQDAVAEMPQVIKIAGAI